MALCVCISDFWHELRCYEISTNNELQQLPELRSAANLKHVLRDQIGVREQPGPRVLRRLRLLISGIDAFYLVKELELFTQFRKGLLTNPQLSTLQLLWFQIVPPEKDIIDYKWNSMLATSLHLRIEMDTLMSWLSTLGGGFSALGEQFSQCAETAGKISLKQLSIGLRLGDPLLQARCKLYYSISLIQTGRLKAAKHIVYNQYRFAIKQIELDTRLVKMCKGIWLRIQHEYRQRRRAKQRNGHAVHRLATVGDQ